MNEAEGKPPTATTAGEGAAEATLLLRGGTPWAHNDVADVLVREGRVAEIAPGIDAPSGEVIDVSGHMLLPGLIDAHCHLDKTLYGGPWTPHSAGDALTDRIANERRRRDELGLPSVDHAAALLERMIAAGTTHVRSHTDIVPDIGLRGVEVVRAAAERFEDRVTVQQVAFPQGGVLTDRATVDLLGGALEAGVEAIGGIDPAGIDRDPVRHLDVVFGLAERHGVAVDIHLHDGGSLGAWELELVIERAKVTGLGERVTISHAYALSQVDELYQDRLVEGLAEAGMSIVTAAAYSFPVPPVKKLRRAGVNVACGHDGIRDLWGPYGTGDMLERAMLLAYRNTFRRDEDIELALDVATYGGARALGVTSYGVGRRSVGRPRGGLGGLCRGSGRDPTCSQTCTEGRPARCSRRSDRLTGAGSTIRQLAPSHVAREGGGRCRGARPLKARVVRPPAWISSPAPWHGGNHPLQSGQTRSIDPCAAIDERSHLQEQANR